MTAKYNNAMKGSSLLELMASLSILLVISAGAVATMNFYQKNYQRTELTADMQDSARSAIDLMAQEIGQAGLLNSKDGTALTTLSAAVASGTQTANVGSASAIFIGEKLTIDAGSSSEVVTVTNKSSTAFTAVFGTTHATGAPIYATGVFPIGILSTSNANELQLIGDINGDGTLVYVEYDCNNQPPGPGTLTRSSTLLSAGAKSASSILVDNVMPNPGGTACFQYPSPLPTAGGFTFVPQVGVTLTVQSNMMDSTNSQYLTITKQALDLVPRNVQLGYTLATNSTTTSALTNFLQNPPTSCVNSSTGAISFPCM